ncbi:MAG: metallophosphoesterase [Oscillospiraceae bacterium]
METKTTKRHTLRNVILIAVAVLVVGGVLYKLISGYIATLPKFDYVYGDYAADKLAAYPDTSFAVMSDMHYYDTSLGTSGAAFEECMQSDRKLLEQSAELMAKAVDNILASNVKFVLVSGDLTKDGERVNHEQVAKQLQRLVDAGIKVYTVPGNHDVNNPGAVKYVGDGTEPVENITEEDFAEIYKNCGYGDAIMRDPSSLSYVAEAQDGLWIVALDTCESENNTPDKEEIWAGELDQTQIDWVQDVLTQAQEQGKAVILLEHHGVVEHWKGQSKLHPDYLLSDYKYNGKFYSSYGVRLAFTGHYHAQDISYENNGDDGFIYDTETGSLSTPPCSFRYCTIKDNSITMKSTYLIDGYSAEFKTEALDFVKKTIYNEAYKTLKKYHVSDADTNYLANVIASAYVEHYNGNENKAEKITVDTGKLNLWGKIVYSQYAYVIKGLTNDLPPDDTDCAFSLASAS